jgi:hypothetical protein
MSPDTQLFVENYLSMTYPDDAMIDDECIAFIDHTSEILEPCWLPIITKTPKEKVTYRRPCMHVYSTSTVTGISPNQ